MKTVGIIPSRYASSRFPGKPLADICGKPMVWWVYKRCMQSEELDEIYVATDDDRIYNKCTEYSIPVLMTSPDCVNGTERVFEVSKKIDADLYINIQGDEPLIEAENINKVVTCLKQHPDVQVSTLKTKILDPVDAINTTVTKVVCNLDGDALYLTRLPIPYPKSAIGYPIFRHMGLYGYRKNTLHAYSELKRGDLEKAEDVEVLRFLENGIKVRVIETTTSTVSVDTKKDLDKVCKIIENGDMHEM